MRFLNGLFASIAYKAEFGVKFDFKKLHKILMLDINVISMVLYGRLLRILIESKLKNALYLCTDLPIASLSFYVSWKEADAKEHGYAADQL